MRYPSLMFVASLAMMSLVSCTWLTTGAYPTLSPSQTKVAGSHNVGTATTAPASESERVYDVRTATGVSPLEPGKAPGVQVPGKDPYASIPSSTLTRPETTRPSTPFEAPYGMMSSEKDTSRFTIPSTPSTPSTPAITFSTEGLSGTPGPSLPGAP